jgi:hypothetical protein
MKLLADMAANISDRSHGPMTRKSISILGEGMMFELETTLKLFKPSDDGDTEIPLTLEQARDIMDKFSAMRTSLRRIVSLDEKNIPKYAKGIAEDGLRLSH